MEVMGWVKKAASGSQQPVTKFKNSVAHRTG